MIYDKVDEHVKRYRELGKGCIEFEPTVSNNGLEIPQSELAVYNAARRAAQERAAKNMPHDRTVCQNAER